MTTIRLWQPNLTTIPVRLLTIHFFSPICTSASMEVEIDVQQGEEEELREDVEGRLVEEKLLVSALECPVCLCLPHSPPVYTCRVVLLIRHPHFSCLPIHARLGIQCVADVGEISPTDVQFASANITGEFLPQHKLLLLISQAWNNYIG